MIKNRHSVAAFVLGSAAILLTACGGSASNSAPSVAASVAASAATPPAPSVAASAAAAPVAPSPAPSEAGSAAAAMLPQEYRDKGFINVASDIPYPPMEILEDDGTVSGLDYDLSQALGELLGIEVRFNKQAWDSIIPSLQSGRHDMIWSGMNDTIERENTLDFVNYFHGGMSILVKKGNPEGITTLLDFCGKTVAVETSTVQGEIVAAASKKCPSGEITIIELPTDGDAQTAVRAGKAVADVLDSAVASYAAQTAGDGKYFEVVIDPANPAGYSPIFTGVGVLKEDSGLTAAVQAGLQELLDNGTYQQIMDKYEVGTYRVDSIVINGATQ